MSAEDDARRLSDVLIAAKRANDFGRGSVDDRIVHVLPLMEALSEALRMHKDYRTEAHALMATLHLQRYYPHDPMMGSEPLGARWIVAKPEPFHRSIERLRERFPERSEFVG